MIEDYPTCEQCKHAIAEFIMHRHVLTCNIMEGGQCGNRAGKFPHFIENEKHDYIRKTGLQAYERKQTFFSEEEFNII